MKTWKYKSNKIFLAYSPRLKLISILHIKSEWKKLQKLKIYICSKIKTPRVTKNKRLPFHHPQNPPICTKSQ
jgi:hypothetical protein